MRTKLAVWGILMALVLVSASSFPRIISFQGRLIDPTTGNPPAGWNLCGHFPTVRRALRRDTHLDGCVLGDHKQRAFFGASGQRGAAYRCGFSDTLYLGISVDGGEELEPRYELAASPYAFYSIHSDTADVAVIADSANYSEIAGTALSVSWYNVTDMPPDFADGVDDEGAGATYTAREGIEISG